MYEKEKCGSESELAETSVSPHLHFQNRMLGTLARVENHVSVVEMCEGAGIKPPN